LHLYAKVMAEKNIPTYAICNLLNQENKKEDFVILDLNTFLTFQASLIASAHRHHFYQLLFITEGSGIHTIDFNNYNIEKGELYILAPGQIHKWLFHPSTCGYVINFTTDFFASFLCRNDYLHDFSFFIGNGNNSRIKLDVFYDVIETTFVKIDHEYKDKEHGNLDLIRIYLLALFHELEKALGKQNEAIYANKPQMDLLNRFDKLLEANYINKKRPKEYAELLFVTPNHLNAVCQKIRNISAGEVIRNRILLEAKRLLTNSLLTISEIAYQLNFADNSYFSRFFKKHTGKSPENFRKQKLEVISITDNS